MAALGDPAKKQPELCNTCQGLYKGCVQGSAPVQWHQVDQAGERRAPLPLMCWQSGYLVLEDITTARQEVKEQGIITSLRKAQKRVCNIVGLIAKNVDGQSVIWKRRRHIEMQGLKSDSRPWPR